MRVLVFVACALASLVAPARFYPALDRAIEWATRGERPAV